MVLLAIFGILIVLLIINLFFIFKPGRYDGYIVVSTDETGKRIFSLELDKPLDYLKPSREITFKVIEPPDLPVEPHSAE